MVFDDGMAFTIPFGLSISTTTLACTGHVVLKAGTSSSSAMFCLCNSAVSTFTEVKIMCSHRSISVHIAIVTEQNYMWSIGVTGSLCNSCCVVTNHIHNVSYNAYLLIVNTHIRSFCSQVSLGRDDELTGFCVFIFWWCLLNNALISAVAEMFQS